jgi:hypothetical protein
VHPQFWGFERAYARSHPQIWHPPTVTPNEPKIDSTNYAIILAI